MPGDKRAYGAAIEPEVARTARAVHLRIEGSGVTFSPPPSGHHASLRQLRQGHPMRDVRNRRVSKGLVPLPIERRYVGYEVCHAHPGTREHVLPDRRQAVGHGDPVHNRDYIASHDGQMTRPDRRGATSGAGVETEERKVRNGVQREGGETSPYGFSPP